MEQSSLPLDINPLHIFTLMGYNIIMASQCKTVPALALELNPSAQDWVHKTDLTAGVNDPTLTENHILFSGTFIQN